MSYTLKANSIKIKSSDGTQTSTNIIVENSTSEALQQIENKKTEVINSLPSDYTELSNKVINIEGKIPDGDLVTSQTLNEELSNLDFTTDYDELLNKPIDRVNNKVLNYASNIMNGQLRNIYFSTEEPTNTDGKVGDIWIVYQA